MNFFSGSLVCCCPERSRRRFMLDIAAASFVVGAVSVPLATGAKLWN